MGPTGPAPSVSAPGKKPYKLLTIIVLVAILAIVLYASWTLFGISSPGKVLYDALNSQPYNLTAVTKVIYAHINATKELNVTYTGIASFSYGFSGYNISLNLPVKLDFRKYGNSSILTYNISTNGTLGVTSEAVAASVFNFNGTEYTCASVLGTETCDLGINSSVISASLVHPTQKSSYTNVSLSQSSYKGMGCFLSHASFNLTGLNLSSAYSSLSNLSSASVYGNYTACFSSQYFLPLTMNISISRVSIKSYGASVSVKLKGNLKLNETGISNTTSPSDIFSAFPISQSCSSAFSTVNCTAPVVGQNGYARVTLSEGLFGTAQNIGIACSQYSPAAMSILQSYSLPSREFATFGITSGKSETVTLQCYDAHNNTMTNLKGGDIFLANIYLNSSSSGLFPAYISKLGQIVTRVSNGPVQAEQPPPTVTTSATTTISYFQTTTTVCSNTHSAPFINITSTGTGSGGAYNTNDTVVWYGVVSPYATAQLSIVNASTGSSIVFTPNEQADACGDLAGTFQAGSNIKPGLTYLRLLDLSTGLYAQSSFIKAK